MQNLIGAIVIALAVGGAIAYNGHQDRLQRQCLAALDADRRTSSTGVAVLYSIESKTGWYCAGWKSRRRR